MKPISRSELAKIVAPSDGYVVSICMPGYVGVESRQNPVRFKNLLAQGESQLLAKGLRRPDVEAMLAPANGLLEDLDFWNAVGNGLLTLINSRGLRHWKLPIACQERCVVGDDAYVIPLVEWLSSELSYYVLAVSQNEVRVYYGTRSAIERIDVPGLPPDRDTALQLDEQEPYLSAHTSQTQATGRGDLAFHGHGGAPDASKPQLQEFMHVIDRALADYLQMETRPLVFVGVDYLFPIFQNTNSYRHLVPKPVTGNPELWSDVQLQERAWAVVEPILDERHESTLTKYGNLLADGRSLDRLESILVAAQAGAVETLMVDPGAERWGRFSPDMSGVRFDTARRQDSEELINLATVLVLRSSGAVEPLESDKIPGGRGAAAILRYAFPPAHEAVGKVVSSRS